MNEIETNVRYKMYKAGKRWLVAGATVLVMGAGAVLNASADEVQTNAQQTAATEKVAEVPSATDDTAVVENKTAATTEDTNAVQNDATTTAEVTVADETPVTENDVATDANVVETDQTATSEVAVAEPTLAVASEPVVQKEVVQTQAIQPAADTTSRVQDPDYPADMWIDPNKDHYTFQQMVNKDRSQQIILSTNRTGDGVIFANVIDNATGQVVETHEVAKNTSVTFKDGQVLYNDNFTGVMDFGKAKENYTSDFNFGAITKGVLYGRITFFVPERVSQKVSYVDIDNNPVLDENGQTVLPVYQEGLTGQRYTTPEPGEIKGHHLVSQPQNGQGTLSQFGEIGSKYVRDFHTGLKLVFTEKTAEGDMKVEIFVDGQLVDTIDQLGPNESLEHYAFSKTVGGEKTEYVYIRNPYVTQTKDVVYVYEKDVTTPSRPVDPDGNEIPHEGTDFPKYPGKPGDPITIDPNDLPDIPGYEKPKDPIETTIPENGKTIDIPYTPVDKETPVDTETPSRPVDPDGNEIPHEGTDFPKYPGKPGDPITIDPNDLPDIPGYEKPKNPIETTIPENGKTIDIPYTPVDKETPVEPGEPQTPENPAKPVEPQTPGNPAKPAEPQTPVAPEANTPEKSVDTTGTPNVDRLPNTGTEQRVGLSVAGALLAGLTILGTVFARRKK